MIMKIQLRQVLRNKRFLIFTIFVPVIWYIFIYNVQKGIVPNIMFGIAVFIGIIGNSMATFSKRISSNIDFFSFESKFTKYSVKRYLLDHSAGSSEHIDFSSSARSSSCYVQI
jgi:putative membrane protein